MIRSSINKSESRCTVIPFSFHTVTRIITDGPDGIEQSDLPSRALFSAFVRDSVTGEYGPFITPEWVLSRVDKRGIKM